MARVGILIALLATAAFAADDPFLGTWKCNFDKSSTTVANPPPHPVSMTLRYERQGDGFRITAESVAEDGQKRSSERIVVYDGLEHPQTPGGPPGDVVVSRRISHNTEEIVYKSDGKVTTRISRVVSADGKTLTYTSHYTPAKGEPNVVILVYEKQ